jgi:hypothetical protein
MLRQKLIHGFDFNFSGSLILWQWKKKKNGFRSKASHFRWGVKAQQDQRLLAYSFWKGLFFHQLLIILWSYRHWYKSKIWFWCFLKIKKRILWFWYWLFLLKMKFELLGLMHVLFLLDLVHWCFPIFKIKYCWSFTVLCYVWISVLLTNYRFHLNCIFSCLSLTE